jgi:hypothetical protein
VSIDTVSDEDFLGLVEVKSNHTALVSHIHGIVLAIPIERSLEKHIYVILSELKINVWILPEKYCWKH